MIHVIMREVFQSKLKIIDIFIDIDIFIGSTGTISPRAERS